MEAVDQEKLAPSISMVPVQLRSVKKEAYRPQMVTVGPYHHGNSVLLGMEKHKRHYMQTLLGRVQNPEDILDDCYMAIKNLNQRVRECYADNMHFGAAGLGAILLVDGCFILELFHRHIIQQHTSNSSDPNADNVWMVPTLRHDLELLENQIPFFILVELYKIFQKHLHIFSEYSLPSLALSFFHPNVNVNQEGMSMEPNHLLDLLHKSLLPTPSNDSSGSETRGFDLCASELLEAGIQFEKISESHLLDIKFDSGNGVIKIPPLSIHKTELLLRNLIALEHCGFHNSCKTLHISSYALMMRSLIRSLADVELLEEKGIISSNSVGGESILCLIDDICKNVDIKDFYFGELCKEVNAYCNSRTCRMPKEMEADWLLPLKEKLGLLGPTLPTPSISKVPKKLRKVDKEAYSPQMVSIGPYHHGNLDLLGMEEHKMQYMRNLLHRGENDSVETLDDCGKAIKNLDFRVRECYADKIRFESFDATKLGEILLVDGCFIIELFYKYVIQQDTNLNDPIANNAWMVSALQHDLVLLENQIPFFILVELYNIFHRCLNISPEHSLTSLTVSFLNLKLNVRREGMSTEPNHLLDLLHKCLLPTSGSDSSGSPPSNDSSGSKTRGFHLCASKLSKAGIQFKKNESHLLDIKFDGGKGVIKIPPFSVGATKSLLRNLIALEQCGFSNSCKTFHISSYALMMRSLIRSSADVQLLEEKGIITSDLEGSESVLGLINDNCKNVYIKHFYFRKLCKEVNAYIKPR
ncbi:uncharacterized protein LOC104880189 [Vitis vinifera]|nr:uncharacterized protein LOC104880189 [Vitis vinifera]